MTVSELQAYVGAGPATGATYFRARAPFLITAWEGVLAGRSGWWWALTRTVGAHEVVAAMGFAAGTRRDRDVDIANALLRLVDPQAFDAEAN